MTRDSSTTGALTVALELFDVGVAMMRENLRRRHPQATDREIDTLLGAWLHNRPGAEFGDSAGRPLDVAARFG